MLSDKALTESTLYSCSLKNEEIDLYYLLALLNSNFLTYIVRQNMVTNEQAFPQIMMTDIKLLKIPKADDMQQSSLSILCKDISVAQKTSFEFISKFQVYLNQKFNLVKLSKKLQNWHELEFGDFIKELNKAIKANNKLRVKEGLEEVPTLTKKDEFEWLDLFEENKQKAQALQTQINQTDAAIDAMVYELYGLTEDEIAIVENS